MGGPPAKTISLFGAPAVPVGDDGPDWLPVRRELGIDAFGINAYRADDGRTVIEEHVESPGQEEVYVVLHGSARFSVDDESFELHVGDAMFVPDPEARRAATALADGTAVLAVGGWPGAPYHPLPWEPIYLAGHEARQGNWERAAQILEDESGAQRESAFVRFHLARAKCQLNDEEGALAELRLAVERNHELLSRAENDDVLARLRQRPDWPA